mgnify:FL=1
MRLFTHKALNRAEVCRYNHSMVDERIVVGDDQRPWRQQAEESLLLVAMEAWHGESDVWLEAALPRLNETLRVNPLRRECDWVRQRIEEMGGRALGWVPNAYVMPWERGGAPADIKPLFNAFHETGRTTRQEAVSMLPPMMFDLNPEEIVLDMCASPGSKSTHLAEILAGRGGVIANDVSRSRTNTLVANAQRASCSNLMIIQHDGRHVPRGTGQGYDAVLVDAPCTGSATTRKNPDVWRKWQPSAGLELHKLQISLLNRAIDVVRPGGTVVYSTCSIDPVENEAVIARILEERDDVVSIQFEPSRTPGLIYRPGMDEWVVFDDDMEIISDGSGAPPHDPKIREELGKCVRLLQQDTGQGGFFFAILQKNADAMMEIRPDARRIIPNSKRKGIHPSIVSEETLDIIQTDHDPILSDASIWKRGKRILWASQAMNKRVWDMDTNSRPDRIHLGKQWSPLNIIHVGVRGWEDRGGRNIRLSSEAMHSIPLGTEGERIHDVTPEALIRILKQEEPAENEQGYDSGGHILRCEFDGVEWRLPVWVGERITGMWKDTEALILLDRFKDVI